VDLHPLDPLGLNAPAPVDAGWLRAIRHGPMTVEQILERARRAMDEQDRLEALAADRYISPRRPGRSLLAGLLGR